MLIQISLVALSVRLTTIALAAGRIIVPRVWYISIGSDSVIKLYKKKSPTIRAVQWTGLNLQEIKEFVGENLIVRYYSTWESDAGGVIGDLTLRTTYEGDIHINQYDYIVEVEPNDFYPYAPEMFERFYEEVQDSL